MIIVVLASYGLRLALAISFYAISMYGLPIFQTLQLGDGFWLFARDAPWYHWNAARIAEAFRWGTEIPPLMVGGQLFLVEPDFYLAVAFVYRILGAHPLYIPLLNAMLWSAISILAYLLARRMKGEEAGRMAVVLVSLWPSPHLWSSQILKDTLVIFLLLSALSLCVQIFGQRGRLWLAAFVPLVVVSFLLTRFRFYLLPIVVLAVGGGVVSSLFRSSRHGQWGNAARGLLLAGVLLATFLGARSVDPAVLLSPAQPETGHLQKAPENRDAMALARPHPESGILAGVLKTFSLGQLASARKGFATAGGASNVGDEVKLEDFWSIVAYLPRGLSYVMFAPFPWHLLSPAGDTGIFKWLSGIEVMLILVTAPFLLIATVRAARSGLPEAWVLMIFGIVLASVLGLVVTNIGTLFRLRLQFLVPMFVILAAYGGGDLRRVVSRLLPPRRLRQSAEARGDL